MSKSAEFSKKNLWFHTHRPCKFCSSFASALFTLLIFFPSQNLVFVAIQRHILVCIFILVDILKLDFVFHIRTYRVITRNNTTDTQALKSIWIIQMMVMNFVFCLPNENCCKYFWTQKSDDLIMISVYLNNIRIANLCFSKYLRERIWA